MLNKGVRELTRVVSGLVHGFLLVSWRRSQHGEIPVETLDKYGGTNYTKTFPKISRAPLVVTSVAGH